MTIRLFFCFNLLIIYSAVSAQFGLRAKYNSAEYNDWDQSLKKILHTDKNMLSSGLELGVDYWFKLKKRRIEFMPELSYSSAKTSYNLVELEKISLSALHFNFNTHIYALDLEGDCNCPTFSKQGTTINKGLFFHFTPGISYNNLSTKTAINSTHKQNFISFKAGIGLGLDVGVSDLLTFTPIISYYFSSTATNDWFSATGVDTNPKLLQASLRIGFRPDYGRSGRRRR